MADGTSLRKTWYNALSDAESHFKTLLASSSSSSTTSEWRRVSVAASTQAPNNTGKGKGKEGPNPSDVLVHRNRTGEWRAILELPLTGHNADVGLDAWHAVLVTPELRRDWDPAVEEAHSLEVIDRSTRISRTNYRLGWPANPRDAVVISRTFSDTTTLIDISTSVPRSPDEPAWLRPNPPHVRSHVKLFAWCIQHIPVPPPQTGNSPPRKHASVPRLRITCLWSHDLKAMWASSASNIATTLSSMVLGLHRVVASRGARVPVLDGFGNGVSLEKVRYANDREQLTLEYSIVDDDGETDGVHIDASAAAGEDALHAGREAKRLARAVEIQLPTSSGWDIQISTKASRPAVAQLPYYAIASRTLSSRPSASSPPSPTSLSRTDKLLFNLSHAALPDSHSILKVRLTIELGATSGLRLNGLPHAISDPPAPTTPSASTTQGGGYAIPQSLAQEATSASNASFAQSSQASVRSFSTSTASFALTAPDVRPQMARNSTERSAAQEKSVQARVRRNYIYFSSLLQEPEAKWRPTTAARGVEVTQLDSIDPTLVVYRAEATFVGVGLWDLVAAITSPGARGYWDKLHEDAVLLDDVSELSKLWHYKTRAAWPSQGRDSALLSSVYRGPGAAHVFSFSVDETGLFPTIPREQAGVIRTQVDLYGWSIEALSPTTTLVTLLEQSDPKGWAGKGGTPLQMISAVASLGEFAIKMGGPPSCTRLAGARMRAERYEHDRGVFRLEYEPSRARKPTAPEATMGSSRTGAKDSEGGDGGGEDTTVPLECELRADIDSWAVNLDVVVDPPPQTITCLRRHRLAAAGGGLWLTLTHDSGIAPGERILAIVRRGPSGGKEKGIVMVNGSRVQVDVEDMPEEDIKAAQKQKRSKPTRTPLDRPPVLGVIRKRWPGGDSEQGAGSPGTSPQNATFGGWTTWIGNAYETAGKTTREAVKAISPPVTETSGDEGKRPMQAALDALAFVHAYHGNPSKDGWTLVGEKGFAVHRKTCTAISETLPVHRGEKVIEGVCAEEIVAVLTSYGCRSGWDDRFAGATTLQTFGAEAHTAFVVGRAGFPFRDRGFLVASITARTSAVPSASRRNSGIGGPGVTSPSAERAAVFVVNASFPPDALDTAGFSATAYNPQALPIGRLLLDGWILETLDPYGAESYTIPSTRVTRLVAIDYAGNIPAAMNASINAALPRQVLSIESHLKQLVTMPVTRLPPPGLVVATMVENPLGIKEKERKWAMKSQDSGRTLVSTAYAQESKTYRSVVIIGAGSMFTAPRTEESHDVTPKPSRLSLHRRRTSDASVPTTSRRRQNSTSTAPTTSPPTSPDQHATIIARPVSPTSPSFASSPPSSMRLPPTVHQRSKSRSIIGAAALASVFTARGEVRQPIDWLVAEIVLDAKLYQHGCELQIRTRIRDVGSKVVALPAPPEKDAQMGAASENILPVTVTAHILPSSPLHSSGLSADKSTRHLVRLSLPTAQFQRPTLQDPLTGEMRTALPRPKWLVDLHERGAVVDVRVVPLSKPDGKVNAKDADDVKDVNDASGKSKGKGPMSILYNDVEVKVQNDSESFGSLGRDELTDDRFGKMATISIVDEATEESLPSELVDPVAVAQNLLGSTSPYLPSLKAATPGVEEKDVPSVSTDSLATSNAPASSPAPTEASRPSSTTSFQDFWSSYPAALTRLVSFAPRGVRAASASARNMATATEEKNGDNATPGPSTGTSPSAMATQTVQSIQSVLAGPSALVSDATREGLRRQLRPQFSLPAVLLIALVAFLLGSLLRSLISPADFVYVVTDARDLGAAAEQVKHAGLVTKAEEGWREIRRLLELKYIVGGWDFQIAVVRRH